jgi:cobalt-zinc-cadmium resistance protein CzcA
MIAKLVSFALRQRFLVVIASLALMLWGAIAFQKLPIDAYPDLSPPRRSNGWSVFRLKSR